MAQRDPAACPYRSFRGQLDHLDHLVTSTRNQIRFTGTNASRSWPKFV